MNENTLSPTLIVGVGGIGSRMANSLWKRLPENLRTVVGVHAFDTDTNDLSQLDALAGRYTQTSGPWTVGQYLNSDKGQGARAWFPDDKPELLQKTLTEGAGQVRAVSRLGLYARLQTLAADPNADTLRKEVRRIMLANGRSTYRSVRVVVVGSLMGGTGSGIFIQVALYLRDLLRREFQVESAIMRGAFMLPDALIHGGSPLPAGQAPNILANAYASLKEVDAIINATRGGESTTGAEHPEIELEFRPDHAGTGAATLTVGAPPFDAIFLWDYETGGAAAGAAQGIGSASNYLRQMEDAVYMQLFTSLGSKQASIEDNLILGLIADQGRSRYAGAGVARVEYPYESILGYCAARWSAKSLSNDWRYLDEQFKEMEQKHRQDVRRGIPREKKPDRREHFRVSFETVAQSGDAGSDSGKTLLCGLYPTLWASPNERDKEQRRSARFVKSLEVRVERLLKAHPDYQAALDESKHHIDRDDLTVRERAPAQLPITESYLERLRQIAMEIPQQAVWGLAAEVLWDGCETDDLLKGLDKAGDHVLNKWLLASGEPLHPLAARWMLCDIRHRLRELRDGNGGPDGGLIKRCERLEDVIRSYRKVFDNPDTDQVEGAADQLAAALDQNRVAALFSSRFKAWSEEYLERFGNHKSQVQAYVQCKLQLLVIEQVLRAIDGGDGLLDQYEQFFDQLGTEAELLRRQAEEQEGEHTPEVVDDPTRVYACADRACKQALWDDVENDRQIGSDELGPEISKRLQTVLYKRAWTEVREQRKPADRVDEIYRKVIHPWAVGYIRERCRSLDMSVVQALQREAAIRSRGKDGLSLAPVDHVREVLGRLNRIAQPFLVPKDRTTAAGSLQLWGMGADVRAELRGLAVGDTVADGEVVAMELPRTQLVRYRTQFGFKAEDLAKFSAGPQAGSYYTAYRKRLDEVLSGKSVSPHIDKNWHLPAYMADLNQKAAQQDRDRLCRAFVLGLALGVFTRSPIDGRPRWAFTPPQRTGTVIAVQGRRIGPALSDLWNALAHHPAHVDAVHEVLERATTEAAERRAAAGPRMEPIDSHRLIQGLRKGIDGRPLPDLLAEMYEQERSGEATHNVVTEELVPALWAVLKDYCRASIKGDQTALDKARDIYLGLLSDSLTLGETEPHVRHTFYSIAGIEVPAVPTQGDEPTRQLERATETQA